MEAEPREVGPCEVCAKPTTNVCSACLLSHFCSKQCQKAAWKRHKRMCSKSYQKLHQLCMRTTEKEKVLVELRALLKDETLDVNAQDTDRQGHASTPLLHAVDSGHAKIVAELLKHAKIDPNLGSARTQFTPLLVAVENGAQDIVKLLMAHKRCDVNLGTAVDGTTPLIHSCSSNKMAIAAELMRDPRVDINRTNTNGSSTLSIACQCGSFGIAQLLLARPDFQNINQRNSIGATPFSYLCQVKGSNQLKIMKELFLPHPGLDASLANHQGLAPLHLATCSGNVDALRLLLARPETNINVRDIDGASSVYKACEGNQHESLRELLTFAGVDLTLGHARDAGSAVNMASQFNHHLCLTTLLQHPDAHKAINIGLLPHGATGLFMACQYGFVESVKALVSHPACDVNKACKDGDTPLLAACRAHVTGMMPSVNPNANKSAVSAGPPRPARERQIDIIKLLMSHPSIDVNSSKGNFGPPLRATADPVIQALLRARGARG